MLRVLPLEPDPAVRAARQIARRGSPELALGVWERLATRPSPPSVAVAEVLRLTPPSRIVEAADLVAEARAANPDEPALVLVEAEARLRSGATAEGYGLLRIYLAEAPAEDDVGRSQALVLSAEPRLDQPDAVSVFKSLLALPDAGGHSEGAIRTWLQAEVDLAEGRGAKALRGFRAATDARPDVPLLQARLQRAREVLR